MPYDSAILDDAIRLLGPKALHQRPTVEREIARIVDQFVADRGVDAIDLGPRRGRVKRLRSITSLTESIRHELALLNPADCLRIGIELDPELSAIELVQVPLAVEAMRSGTGLFGLKIRDKT